MEQIEGRHPVLEAMKANRPIESIFLLKDGKGEAFSSIEYLAREKKIEIRYYCKNQWFHSELP